MRSVVRVKMFRPLVGGFDSALYGMTVIVYCRFQTDIGRHLLLSVLVVLLLKVVREEEGKTFQPLLGRFWQLVFGR